MSHKAFYYWYKPGILIRQIISRPKEILAKRSRDFNPNIIVRISLEFGNGHWRIYFGLVCYVP